MENISKHITYKEATKSQSAIRAGIDNKPNTEQLAKMKLVANNVFEPIREWYNKPITVSSFFRNEAVNKLIKGSKSSQHCTGEAMDIDTEEDNAKLFNYIKDNLQFDQLIWEFGDDKNPDWVHVSFSKNNNRKEILKAIKINGKTKYITF